MILSSSSIEGTSVVNRDGQDIGSIKDLMINTNRGSISYAVLSFGGFMGINDKYFAIPFEAFTVDTENERLVLNIDKDKLENAPGFDKDNWPTNANHDYLTKTYQYYGYEPNWN